jgi:hypothetical protein
MKVFEIWLVRTVVIGVALMLAMHAGIAGLIIGAAAIALLTPRNFE